MASRQGATRTSRQEKSAYQCRSKVFEQIKGKTLNLDFNVVTTVVNPANLARNIPNLHVPMVRHRVHELQVSCQQTSLGRAT
eukprot:6469735-Amphidinium_carterae.2